MGADVERFADIVSPIRPPERIGMFFRIDRSEISRIGSDDRSRQTRVAVLVGPYWLLWPCCG